METPYWLSDVREFIFGGNGDGHAIPPLDAGLAPNDRLEHLERFAGASFPEVNDIVLSPHGDLFVATADGVVGYRGGHRTLLVGAAELGGVPGAMLLQEDGRLLVCVAGLGIVAVSPGGAARALLSEVAGRPLRCATAIVAGRDGALYITQGSADHDFEQWVWDLMERNSTGRLIRCDTGGGRAEVLLDRLPYPNGLTLAGDGASLLLSLAWDHSILRYHLDGAASGRLETVATNLVGYPAAISPAHEGYWLSIFALRTHLVEFLLTQHRFRGEMMRTIDPIYWVRPAIRTLDLGLEPTQGGGIKKLGRTKPWAPPRSYGLLARISDDGEVLESLHSRADGSRHGVVSARQYGDQLLICCKGSHEVLHTTLGGSRRGSD